MKLNYIKIGSGEPLLILHGLFGSLDNWKTLGNRFAENYEVYLIDQRNHGKSPHSREFDYHVMSDDIAEFVEDHSLENINLLGHSMGGKTAMTYAQENEGITKLIIADISPKAYEPHHNNLVEAMEEIDFSKINSRGKIEEILSKSIPNVGIRNFLMKNIYWREKGVLDWKINLPIIKENMVGIAGEIDREEVDTPTLFIRGGKSEYIIDEDFKIIKDQFPNSRIETIPGTGHWLHAEEPDIFYDMVMSFLKE